MGLRTIRLEGVANVRDLGGIPVRGGRQVAPGLLYRGSALHGATQRDMRALFEELGIACVVDLRCGWEREAKPNRLPLGVEEFHIPFYDLEKVGIEYTEAADGTKAVGKDVACDPDHFYRSLANPLTVAQIAKALRCILDRASEGVPVYQHCSGGKDRTGVMTMLMLTVLGASEEDIMSDYLLTNVARDADYDRVYQRFLRLADGDSRRARELVESHRARPENLFAFLEAVEEAYGGIGEFVTGVLGVDEAACARFRNACTRPQHEARPVERITVACMEPLPEAVFLA